MLLYFCCQIEEYHFGQQNPRVMKLVDVPDSKSGGEIRAGSSPVAGTNEKIKKGESLSFTFNLQLL